jgi:hypothetical protein
VHEPPATEQDFSIEKFVEGNDAVIGPTAGNLFSYVGAPCKR